MAIDYVDGGFMHGYSYEFRLGFNVMQGDLELYVVAVGPDGRVTHCAEPLVFQPVDARTHQEPTMRLGERLAQQLMTALERERIKPESASKLEGVLEATRRHLEDMRLLAGVTETVPVPNAVSGR